MGGRGKKKEKKGRRKRNALRHANQERASCVFMLVMERERVLIGRRGGERTCKLRETPDLLQVSLAAKLPDPLSIGGKRVAVATSAANVPFLLRNEEASEVSFQPPTKVSLPRVEIGQGRL